MSDLLNSASLVMIPSGYAEDKVYSVVPSDGSGDMTLTRASNGTRVNSAGLVEVCPWNLLQQSETFDTSWTTSNVTITANNTTAPNGTTTAEKALCASGSSISPNIFYSAGINCENGQIYTYSYYAKKGSTNFAKIRFSGTAFASVTNSPIFNLNTGVVVSGTGTIESVGNGWYRISATATAESSASGVVTVDIPSSTGVWPNGNFAGTEYIFIWGAQLNIGSTAKPYFPTTDRLNVPRLTYQNGGGGCPSLLLEKQSTNLALYSEQFGNADWQKFGTSFTVTANNAISPDGTQNADTLNIANNNNILYQSKSGTFAGNTYTFSIYAKGSGTFVMNVRLNGTTTTTQTKTLSSTWQRFDVTVTNAIAVIAIDTYLELNTSSTMAVWGAQLEASSYPTSYTPTTSSSATRVADACFKTGISSLIGQTEGTIFWDVSNVFQFSSDGARFFAYTNSSNFILINPYGTTMRILIVSSGTAFDNFITISGTSLKIAVAYKANDYKFYVNGVSVGTPTVTSVPAMNAIGIINDIGFPVTSQSETKQLILFKTRLTNAELASITTI